jgi:2-keto-4-pentenoate hydratase/2-oxohepta-3-ene-1,7-dioic acid hydratase in catechol pathway
MRLVTFRDAAGVTRPGALTPGGAALIDLSTAWRAATTVIPAPSSLQGLIEAGPAAWDHARRIVEAPTDEAIAPLDAVALLAPLPRPVRMRDFSVFETHAALDGRVKLPEVWYEWPVYYKCNVFSVVGPDATVTWPEGSDQLDYELELAAIIGTGGKRIQREQARDHIFGFTIFNDLSARDWQMKEMVAGLGPARGKDFDGANVLGPVIATADEIGDPYALTMVARVNGEEWSRGSSAAMRHSFEAMIAFVSEGETLQPGEVFGSGTIGGGCGLEIGRFLHRGDLVELEIERIGVLGVRVV